MSREENKAEPLNILALTFAINPIDYDNSIQHLKFYKLKSFKAEGTICLERGDFQAI